MSELSAQIISDNESITTAEDIFGYDSDDDIDITPPPRNGPGHKVILCKGPDGKLYLAK